jgi:NADH/NAD ratio-sensing transcriptional regulator Rex
VGEGISNLKNWSLKEKPTWCWIETTRINSTVKPTPAQVRSEVWMAIIHGATGVGYFCHEFSPSFNEDALLDDSQMKTAVTALNSEVQGYASILNSLLQDDSISVDVATNSQATVKVLVKHDFENIYLFAIGLLDTSAEATFSVQGLAGAVQSVEVLGENRTLVLDSGQFADTFSGYGVHIYKISHQLTLSGDVNNNRRVDLEDLITSLQVLTGMPPAGMVTKKADCNNDRKIGLAEAMYILAKEKGVN